MGIHEICAAIESDDGKEWGESEQERDRGREREKESDSDREQKTESDGHKRCCTESEADLPDENGGASKGLVRNTITLHKHGIQIARHPVGGSWRGEVRVNGTWDKYVMCQVAGAHAHVFIPMG